MEEKIRLAYENFVHIMRGQDSDIEWVLIEEDNDDGESED